MVAAWRGQHQQRQRLVRASLAIYRSLGDRWGCATALTSLSDVAIGQGRMEEAESLGRRALAMADESSGWADDDISLNRVHLRSGDFAKALQGFEAKAALYGELGLQMRLAEATDDLVISLLHLGRYERAYALAQSNLLRCENAGYRLYTGLAHEQVALVALAQEQPSIAHCHLEETVRIFRKVVGGGSLAGSLAHLGYVERVLDQRAEVEQHLAEALQMTVEGRLWFLLLELLPAMALLLADTRGPASPDVERAVELYALASRYPYVANSRWFEDVAGREIAAAAATLPPDVVAAAQERGRARDLWATAEELLAELEETQES